MDKQTVHTLLHQWKGRDVMRKAVDTYKEIKTFEFPGCIVRVHIPDITEQERARRMKRIHDAAAELLREVYRNERRMQSELQT